MKKLIFIIIFVSNFSQGNCNPYYPYFTAIEKLSFNPDGWELILSYLKNIDDGLYIDSLQLISSTDTATLKTQFPYTLTKEYITFTQDSFNHKFHLNPEGDSIIVHFYYEGFSSFYSSDANFLCFGDLKNAMVHKPSIDECIISVISNLVFYPYNSLFIICKKGQDYPKNDSCYCNMSLKGILYNKKDEPIKYGQFWLDNWFTPDNQGNFEVPITNYLHQTEYIYTNVYYTDDDGNVISYPHDFHIQKLIFNPDTAAVIQADIHLMEDIPVSLVEPAKSKLITISPNPVNNQLTIKGKISSGSICTLFDLKGTKILEFNLGNQEVQTLELPENIVPGIYIVNLCNLNRILYSEKIIINHFK